MSHERKNHIPALLVSITAAVFLAAAIMYLLLGRRGEPAPAASAGQSEQSKTTPTAQPAAASPKAAEADSEGALPLPSVEPSVARDVNDMLNAPFKNELPDVSQWEQPFETTPSFKPLLGSGIKKLTYKAQAETSSYSVSKEKVNPLKPLFKSPMSTVLRELAFKEGGKDGEIVYDETISIEGQKGLPTMTSERKMLTDGRFLRENDGSPEAQMLSAMRHEEMDGKFPEAAVKKGSEWTQRLAVDKELNPEGIATATCKVEATYVKDGLRFVRIRREFGYTSYRPSMSTIGGSQLGKKLKLEGVPEGGGDKSFKMHIRESEVSDLNVDTGVVYQRSVEQRIYHEGHGFSVPGGSLGDGLYVEGRTTETLFGPQSQ